MDTASLGRPALLLAVAVLVGACGQAAEPGGAGGTQATAGPDAAAGYTVGEAVVTGLDGPTQMIEGPDGRLWIAQLAGPEGAGRGQVVAVDAGGGGSDRGRGGEPAVLVEGLDKPTGIAVLDGALWIQQPRSLLRAPLEERDGRTAVGEPAAVLDDLPNNGRSQGTLTPTGDGTLLYETSGARDGAEPVAGSGTLWELDPASPSDPRPLARGLKNAYAHAPLDGGRLAVTDVLEPLPGVETEDELNVLEDRPGDAPADLGWPRCVGRGVPVTELGADPAACGETTDPIALLGTGATPTGVVPAPWDGGTLLVARWSVGDVVAVPVAGGEPEPVLSGLEHPQHLLVDGDAVLVSDHASGRVHRLTRSR